MGYISLSIFCQYNSYTTHFFKKFDQYILKSMEACIHDAEDTLSLSDLHIKDDTIHSEEDSKPNSSSSSSSSSSSFDQDFLGFFSEEWSRDPSYHTSPENIIFCGKIVSSKQSIAGDKKSQQNPQFRSISDSFRYTRFKTASNTPSTWRSKSLPNKSSPCKTRWKVFLFGFGSGKFQSKMDMSDIKIRQLRRRQSDANQLVDGEERRSGKKGWWRLVDVLGCSGGYEKDTMVVI